MVAANLAEQELEEEAAEEIQDAWLLSARIGSPHGWSGGGQPLRVRVRGV